GTRTASISTRAPLGSAATCTVTRAGYGGCRSSSITWLTTAKSPRSVRKTVNRTTSSSVAPAAVATAASLRKTCRTSASTPPGTSVIVAGSSGIWPESQIVPPAATACEYGPMAAGALSVAIVRRVMLSPSRVGARDAEHVRHGADAPEHALELVAAVDLQQEDQ